MNIKKIFLVLTFVTIKTLSFGQTISMYNKKTKDDIEVTNGNYHLYFKKVDIIDAVKIVDKLYKTNNNNLIELINKNTFTKPIDLQSKDDYVKKLLALLKENIGVYLLLKGKATIIKNNKTINKIIADEAPEMVELTGESTRRVFFSEEKSEIEIFLGDMSKKLGTE